MYTRTQPYGLEGHLEHDGGGSCMYRGETFGQPQTLAPGDTLANGLVVAEEWSEEGNGGVGLHFTDGTKRVVAARIPLLLAGGTNGKLPLDLKVGDIFETGCVVLAPPSDFDPESPDFEESRREVEVSITGGLSGHTIGMPKDLLIALYDEVYPPSKETAFGAFVLENTLKMGARARRNLPFYGRLFDRRPEPMRVADVFSEISNLRANAQRARADYEHKLGQLMEVCGELKGVELLITGRLHGRGGTIVHENDPKSSVENMLVEVWSARVNTYEGERGDVARQQPFIEFTGWTVEGKELVVARLIEGESGVRASIPE